MPNNQIVQPVPTGVLCKRCGGEEGRYSRSHLPVKLSCFSCGRYVKFVSKSNLAPEILASLFPKEGE